MNQSIFTIKRKCRVYRGAFVSTRRHVSIKWNNSRKRNNFPSTTIQIHVVCQELDLGTLYALVVSIFIAREIRIRAARVQNYASFISLLV